ncbi:hypothetical protein D9756_005130 [Leucocoprinus leucothites]|uniref:F-box domain-containing protein n=1 Tax=Leucocoprinus leucothites TaxID=201217 RepID=A0A8H5G9F4_9AGAR|nr:hypothetical protein D9756_005130 [Leucoagaricus leucothites]
MMGLNHLELLPAELLLRIAEYSSFPDLKNLRVTSKRIEEKLTPVIFKTFRIMPTLHPSSTALCRDIRVASLASETTVLRRFCHKAEINLPPLRLNQQLPWLDLLADLTPTLNKLRVLSWKYTPDAKCIPMVLIRRFINALGSLPVLKEVHILFRLGAEQLDHTFSLKALSNLSSLSITWTGNKCPPISLIKTVARLLGRSPGLQAFTFQIPRPQHPPGIILFSDLMSRVASWPTDMTLKLKYLKLVGIAIPGNDFHVHLRHFVSLETLKIVFNRTSITSPDPWDLICQTLLEKRIYLKGLAIDCIHPPSVFQYLSSYSGIERLYLHPRHPKDDSNDLVYQFFSSVLPLHQHTLRSFKIGTSIATAWTSNITQEYLNQIAQCKSLANLRCWVTCTRYGNSNEHLAVQPLVKNVARGCSWPSPPQASEVLAHVSYKTDAAGWAFLLHARGGGKPK